MTISRLNSTMYLLMRGTSEGCRQGCHQVVIKVVLNVMRTKNVAPQAKVRCTRQWSGTWQLFCWSGSTFARIRWEMSVFFMFLLLIRHIFISKFHFRSLCHCAENAAHPYFYSTKLKLNSFLISESDKFWYFFYLFHTEPMTTLWKSERIQHTKPVQDVTLYWSE